METYDKKLMGDVIAFNIADYLDEFPEVDKPLLRAAISSINDEEVKRAITYRYKFNMTKKNVIKNLLDTSTSLYMVDKYIYSGLSSISKYIWHNTDMVKVSDVRRIIDNEHHATFRTCKVLFRNGIWTIRDINTLTRSTIEMLDGAREITTEEIINLKTYLKLNK